MKQHIEQSQINAAKAWHAAGYSAEAIATALRLAPGTIRRAVKPATKFGKTQLPVAWTQRLGRKLPMYYAPGLKHVYDRFLVHMGTFPNLPFPALVQLLRPCTFPAGHLEAWVAHYNRYRMTPKLGLLHYHIMKAWWNSQQVQTPPPSSAPAPCDTPPQSSPSTTSGSPQPPPAVSSS